MKRNIDREEIEWCNEGRDDNLSCLSGQPAGSMSEEESVLELGYKVAEVVQEVVFRNQNHTYTCKMNRIDI